MLKKLQKWAKKVQERNERIRAEYEQLQRQRAELIAKLEALDERLLIENRKQLEEFKTIIAEETKES